MTTATKTTKKDELKKSIMNFLNKKVGSVVRSEINQEVKDIASERTIGRALAELKLEGLVTQEKDGNKYLWTSVTSNKKESEAPSKSTADAITDSEKKNDEKAEKKEKKEKKESKKPAKKEKAEKKSPKRVRTDDTVDPERVITKDSIKKFDSDWISALIDQELHAKKMKPTKNNIATIRKTVTSIKFMKKIQKDFPNVWANRMGKKSITKKELVKAGKVNRNASDNGKPQKEKKAPKKTQTSVLRDLIKKGNKKASLIKKLAKALDKSEAWAKTRVAVYEKAYGEMGKNDKNLKK